MCFSAGASFTGGAVLSAIGIAAVKRAHDPSQKLFAEIPLFFAFQQCAEGILWVTLKSGGYYQIQAIVTYIFLIMALVIWPLMIPLAVLRMEEVKKKKMIITGILIFVSCLVTGIFYKEYLTSVWCFFAALISIVFYWIIRESQEKFSLADLKLLKILTDHNPWKKVKMASGYLTGGNLKTEKLHL